MGKRSAGGVAWDRFLFVPREEALVCGQRVVGDGQTLTLPRKFAYHGRNSSPVWSGSTPNPNRRNTVERSFGLFKQLRGTRYGKLALTYSAVVVWLCQ